MKLVCNVSVGNRQLPGRAINPPKRHVKSTLALCKHPNTNDFSIILFTGQNKNGTKYNLKGNITQVLTRFVNEGKATIQFKAPPHDLYIQSDVIQLKGFLHLLKRALENKITEKELTYSSMAVTPVKAKDIAPTKLVVTKRSDYPTKGFPRSLETLYINEIKLCSISKGIFQLKRLSVLDLSHNLIEYLPEELNHLPNLKELNVSFNRLGEATNKNQWKGLEGNLSQTLLLLNLSHNNLSNFPEQICKLYRLKTLELHHNQLKSLPTSIGNLRNLKILSVANNLLTSLPGGVKLLRLDSIDVSSNKFVQNLPCDYNSHKVNNKPLDVCTLKECAARKVLEQVLRSKTPLAPGTLPLTLMEFIDQAKFCVCGKACFNVFKQHLGHLLLSNISNSVSLTSGSAQIVPMDCYYCSLRCFATRTITRYPIT